MKFFQKIDELTTDYAHSSVPLNKRRNAGALFGVWFVFLVNLAFIFFGLTLSKTASFVDVVLAMILTQLILGVLGGFTGYISAKTGLNAGMLLGHVFGRYGSIPIMFAIGLSLLGWFGFQLELFSQSITALLHIPSEFLVFVIAISGVVMITSGVIGFKAVDWLSRIVTPFLVFLISYPLLQYVLKGEDIMLLVSDEVITGNKLGVWKLVSLFLGGTASLLIVTADIMRYAKTPRVSFGVTLSAQIICSSFVFLCAFLVGRLSLESDFISILSSLGLGGFSFLLVMLATWTTNDTNIYISSLAFSGVFQKVRKWKIALFCGFIGIIIGLLGITDAFFQWLVFLGILYGPVGGVFQFSLLLKMLKREAVNQDKPIKKVDLYAVISFSIGVVFATVVHISNGVSFVHITGIPMVDGYLVSAIFYGVLNYKVLSNIYFFWINSCNVK